MVSVSTCVNYCKSRWSDKNACITGLWIIVDTRRAYSEDPLSWQTWSVCGRTCFELFPCWYDLACGSQSLLASPDPFPCSLLRRSLAGPQVHRSRAGLQWVTVAFMSHPLLKVSNYRLRKKNTKQQPGSTHDSVRFTGFASWGRIPTFGVAGCQLRADGLNKMHYMHSADQKGLRAPVCLHPPNRSGNPQESHHHVFKKKWSCSFLFLPEEKSLKSMQSIMIP